MKVKNRTGMHTITTRSLLKLVPVILISFSVLLCLSFNINVQADSNKQQPRNIFEQGARNQVDSAEEDSATHAPDLEGMLNELDVVKKYKKFYKKREVLGTEDFREQLANEEMDSQAQQAKSNINKNAKSLRQKQSVDAEEKQEKTTIDNQAEENSSYENLPYSNSLMFNEDDLQLLYAALKNKGKAIQTIEESQEGELPKVAPAFFLNSIVFLSPSVWSVWLDNAKYNNQIPGLFIERISRDSVVFKWKVKNLQHISPNWQKDFYYVTAKENKLSGSAGYLSKNGNIFIEESGQEIVFLLFPNQSLVSRSMEVVEGFRDDFIIPDPEAANKNIGTDKNKNKDAKETS